MENASKALFMAGGVLIAILVISLAVYLFTSYGRVQTSYDTTLESNEKIKFNTNFEKFKGRTDITAQEIVSIINFAKNYKINNQIHIEVKILGVDYVSQDKDLMEFITDNSNKKYTCNGIDYENGIVACIRFQ